MLNLVSWSDPFFMADWQRQSALKTKYSLGGASLSLWSLSDILDLASPEDAQNWHSQKMQYTKIQGGDELRTVISNQYSDLDKENIVIFSGAQEALTSLFLALLGDSSQVIGLTPSYIPMTLSLQKTGAKYSEFALTDTNSKWSLDFNSLNQKVKEGIDLLVVNFPHNPTGFLPKISDWQGTINLADKNGTWIICDEVFKGLEFNANNALPPVCDLYSKGISVGSLSKAYACPSTRIGWVATHDKKLIEKLMTIKRFLSICSSRFDEAIAKIMLLNKEVVLQKNVSFIKDRLKIFNKEYKNCLSQWIEVQPIDVGQLMFPKLKGDINSLDFCKSFLQKSGCRLEPGLCFGNSYNQHFRLGLGADSFEQNLEKLKNFLSIEN